MSTYYEYIKERTSLSMQEIIDECKTLVPTEYRTRPYRHPELHNGTALLDSEDVLNCYIAAYGEMHMIKCKAALQNFPYDSLSGNIEIVDWGCGQGIASMCLVDNFKEHEIIQKVRQIVLIEPSEYALERAEMNLTIATNGAIYVQPMQCYLPGSGMENEVKELGYECDTVIHLFSNILDVNGIDLAKLANMVTDKSRNNIILCIGPKNSNAYKIEQFCSIFGEQDYFSDIDDPQYGNTSDTLYTFTCKTKCFVYNGNPLNASNIGSVEVPDFKDGKNAVYNEYDPRLAVQNGLISEELRLIYLYLLNQISPNDIIFIRPQMYGKRADIVLICEKKGALIINICDKLLEKKDAAGREKQGDTAAGQDADENGNDRFLGELAEIRIEFFRQNELLSQIAIKDSKNFSLVKTALFLTQNTTEEAKELFTEEKRKYVLLFGKDFIEDKYAMKTLLDKCVFAKRRDSFDKQLVNSLLKELTPQWHSYRQGKLINLTAIQQNLSKSVAKKKQKISGVAGSGKTQVLATRAVNAQIRTGGNILVLTYNKTLSNYLRYRINDVRADFYWKKIHISHYHHFFKEQAQSAGKHVLLGSFDNVSFFNGCENMLHHYDAIFIDEVQSYKSEWLQILNNKFLKKDGEFVVFGDPKQNIYDREIDSNGDIRIGVIGGEWNQQLSKCHRFVNNQLSTLARRFQLDFAFMNVDNFEKSELLPNSNLTCLKYMYDSPELSVNKVVNTILHIISAEKFEEDETVVLAQNSSILKDVEYAYRCMTKEPTVTTFVAADEKNKFMDDTCKKLNFTMINKGLKFSTIHSFQGWDATNVIVLLQPEGEGKGYTVSSALNRPEIIYTAITRPRQNLVIINYGNGAYHDFFSKNMVNENYMV